MNKNRMFVMIPTKILEATMHNLSVQCSWNLKFKAQNAYCQEAPICDLGRMTEVSRTNHK